MLIFGMLRDRSQDANCGMQRIRYSRSQDASSGMQRLVTRDLLSDPAWDRRPVHGLPVSLPALHPDEPTLRDRRSYVPVERPAGEPDRPGHPLSLG
jgi:hypothetical protein